MKLTRRGLFGMLASTPMVAALKPSKENTITIPCYESIRRCALQDSENVLIGWRVIMTDATSGAWIKERFISARNI